MRVLYFSFIVVLLDQITKVVVKGISIPFLGIELKGMKYAHSINVIGDFFKITFVENPGMAFGLDFGPIAKFFLSLFSIIASIGLIIYIYKSLDKRFIFRFALALILGGAVGNLIDRVFYGLIYDYAPLMYGKVVDFLNVDFWDFTLFGHTYDRWPIFNIADASVSIGVVLLVLFNRDTDETVEKAKDEEEIENYQKLKELDSSIS
ncbi:MAG: signal peptidase II [Melioribacteraceae bacterium]|nr:signal peptidase II [Melioribacteraceae bacterium]